jgi:hypothetical protein
VTSPSTSRFARRAQSNLQGVVSVDGQIIEITVQAAVKTVFEAFYCRSSVLDDSGSHFNRRFSAGDCLLHDQLPGFNSDFWQSQSK